MPIYPDGFPDYGTDDDDVVIQAGLTSASDLDGGSNVTGTAEYDSRKGVLLANSGVGDGICNIRWVQSAADYASLWNSGHIMFEIEAAWMTQDHTPAATEIAFQMDRSSDQVKMQKAATSRITMLVESVSGTGFLHNSIGKGEFVRVDVTWHRNEFRYYIDKMFCGMNYGDTNLVTNLYQNIYLGYGLSGFGAPRNHYIRNFQVMKRPLMLPAHQKIRNIVFTGDSFIRLGQYPLDRFALQGINTTQDAAWYPDQMKQINQGDQEANWFSEVERILAENDIFVGGMQYANFNLATYNTLGLARPEQAYLMYGRGGSRVQASGIKPLSERVDALTDASLGEYPDYAQTSVSDIVINIGTNDCATSDVTAQFKVDFQAEITRLVAKWPDIRIYIVETVGRTDADYDADIVQSNTYKSELVDENANCYLVPAYEAFGGASPVGLLIDTIHPNATGFVLLGKLTGEVIANVIANA